MKQGTVKKMSYFPWRPPPSYTRATVAKVERAALDCPWCASRPGSTYLSGDGSRWQVACKHCGASGPLRKRLREAVELWNEWVG